MPPIILARMRCFANAYPCGHLPSEHGPRYGGPSGPQSYLWKSLAMAF